MEVSKLFLFSAIFLLTYQHVCGYRILGIFPHVGKSHSYAFEPLMRGLAEKGHEVTVISHFPLENPPPTFKDISLKGSLKIWIHAFNLEEFAYPLGTEWFMKHVYSAKNLFLIASITCKAMLEDPGVQAIKEGDYDVIIIEQFNSDCGLGIVNKLKIPFIGVTSHVMMAWTTGRLGVIENPSFVPSHYLNFGRNPNMLQTAQSFLLGTWYKSVYYLFSQISERRMMVEYYGEDLPALEDIAKNMSLIMVNTYFPLMGAVPTTPNAVEIGGIHLQNKKALDPVRYWRLHENHVDLVQYIFFRLFN